MVRRTVAAKANSNEHVTICSLVAYVVVVVAHILFASIVQFSTTPGVHCVLCHDVNLPKFRNGHYLAPFFCSRRR